MAVNQKLLAEILIKEGLLKQKSLNALIKEAAAQHTALEDIIFERELVSENKLGPIVANLHGVSFVNLSEITIPDRVLRTVPYTLASNQFVIPFEQTGSKIKVATSNPSNEEIKSFLEKKTGVPVELHYATKKDIKFALKAYNRDVTQKFTGLLKGVLEDPRQIESLKDAAKILDTIILFGYQNNASDIHIEPQNDFVVIRYRVDGLLQTIAELPIAVLDLLTTRIKVLANLRTDEHRAAQDGRFKIDLENNEITMRVSIMPTYDGEKTVLRLLSSVSQELNLDALGFPAKDLKTIKSNILKTHGILLVTGPTGSGKTTTLYSILKLLNSPEVNLSTIEDPIEYRLDGINQIQVNPKTNLTFAKGLRSLLRQDPDILMVGEIRDSETAGIAINAALTGHLVLATLHTNDAASTLPRMSEMGVEPFLIGATVRMIMAQRLVRTICSKCKQEFKVSLKELKGLGEKYNFKKDFEAVFMDLAKDNPTLKADFEKGEITFYKGEGCSACSNSGFKGRTTISEVMEVSDSIKRLLLKGASPMGIEKKAREEGMSTMFHEGMIKVLSGITTIEEILRVMRT